MVVPSDTTLGLYAAPSKWPASGPLRGSLDRTGKDGVPAMNENMERVRQSGELPGRLQARLPRHRKHQGIGERSSVAGPGRSEGIVVTA